MRIIFLPSLLVCSLFANEQNFFELGLGYANIKDNFSTNNDEKIKSYKDTESGNKFLPNVNFYYGKEIDKNKKIYLKAIHHELSLGTKLYTEHGNFYLGAKTKVFEDEWENPFELKVNRKKTDINEYGGFLAYEFSSSNFSKTIFRYEYDKRDYEQDKTIDKLKREANIHSLSLDNIINTDFLKKDTKIFINLKAKKYDAIGKASTYDSVGIDLGFAMDITAKTNLMLLTNFSKKRYDEKNPILNKKIDSNTMKFLARVKYKKPFDFENTFLSFTIGYENENANNPFYDEKKSLILLGIGYTF